MCQQTTVQAVKAYYTKFLDKWPRIQDLAAAEQSEVMEAWAGLGYYARARNLHKCANVIAHDFGGEFPKTQSELKHLPGVGDYTSAAIAAIAFNQPATVMDGNIERIIARLFALEDPLPKAKPVFKEKTALLFVSYNDRPGDLAQALMDIGSSICIPKTPRCMLCPLQESCVARKQGIQETLPVKIKAKNRPKKYGSVYWIINEKNETLFHKRPEKGLLGGMVGLPTTSWELKETPPKAPDFIDVQTSKHANLEVNHVFTHFDLKLTLKTLILEESQPLEDSYFWGAHEGHAAALPTVFKKAYKLFTA